MQENSMHESAEYQYTRALTYYKHMETYIIA